MKRFRFLRRLRLLCLSSGGVEGAPAWWRAALQVRLLLGSEAVRCVRVGMYCTVQCCEDERLDVRLVARAEKTEGLERRFLLLVACSSCEVWA